MPFLFPFLKPVIVCNLLFSRLNEANTDGRLVVMLELMQPNLFEESQKLWL